MTRRLWKTQPEPTRLSLAVNLKTAKAQGIRVPQDLLLRADRVIE